MRWRDTVNILGISGYSHDAAATLLIDGCVVAAAEEERFTRVKHDNAYPRHAIVWCLEHAGLTLHDLDLVAVYWQPWRGGSVPVGQLLRGLTDGRTAFVFRTWVLPGLARNLRPSLDAARLITTVRHLRFVEHHLAHAASAFLASPFDEAAILTVDRRGERTTTMLAHGSGTTITPLVRIEVPHSLGNLYNVITRYLGFHREGDEGKVMGLAPYGQPRYQDHFERWVCLTDDGFQLDTSAIRLPFGPDLIDSLGPPRASGEPLDERHADIAASLQQTLERALLHLGRRLHAATGAANLCMAGGVALNCVANARLAEEGPFRRVWVQPAANDAGASLGAALWVYHAMNGQLRWGMEHAYLGPAYDEAACRAALEAAGLPRHRPADLAGTVARLLAEGNTVGWFQGRMEFGPRALGNRSILADPRLAEMKHVLNGRVKHREPFRPYAPSVLEERAAAYFNPPTSSPFMLFTHQVIQPDIIPAVTHTDGTARVQTVKCDTNPAFHKLIAAFERITGVPVLINTSFNVTGEPIVCTPDQAIATYLSTGLDALALGPFLVKKAEP
jgi:carbamoyltransferase